MTIIDHLQISVLSAPVAAFDRRALSEAWYSALYGASTPAADLPPQKPRLTVSARRPASGATTAASSGPPGGGATVATLAVHPRTAAHGAARELERRAHPSKLADRIVHALLRGGPAKPAWLSLGNARGRVRIFLQCDDGGTRLVALCAPRDAAQVRAALAQARFELARLGISLRFVLREHAR
jgi:hypothetical protein